MQARSNGIKSGGLINIHKHRHVNIVVCHATTRDLLPLRN